MIEGLLMFIIAVVFALCILATLVVYSAKVIEDRRNKYYEAYVREHNDG